MSQPSTPELAAHEAAFIEEVRRDIAQPNIAFIGKMGSGKTTAKRYLQEHHGYVPISFATALKEVAREIWGREAYTDRDKLQKLGVAVRAIDPDAWVNIVARELDDYPGPWVIDDCRFPNEYAALQERGFRFVKIYAPEDQRVDRLMRNGKLTDLEQLNHESEQHIEQFASDYLISNNGDTEDFLERVESVLRREAMRA